MEDTGFLQQRRPTLWLGLLFHCGQVSSRWGNGCSPFCDFSSRCFFPPRWTPCSSSLLYLTSVSSMFAMQRVRMVARVAFWCPLETLVYIHNSWILKHKWLSLGPTGSADTICHVNSHSLHAYFFLKGNYHAKTTLRVLTAAKLPLRQCSGLNVMSQTSFSSNLFSFSLFVISGTLCLGPAWHPCVLLHHCRDPGGNKAQGRQSWSPAWCGSHHMEDITWL